MRDDTIRLPTGRSFYANRRLVSINDELQVGEGYDGSIDGLAFETDDSSNWSREDRAALADLMIERWQHFKDAP
jgi:hypothetical protein